MSAPRRTVLVAVAAVLGIAFAAGITWATSQLVRQRIGLASEPLTAGRRLLPPVTGTPAQRRPAPVGHSLTAPAGTSTRTRSAPAPATAARPAPAATTAAPSSAPPPPNTATAAPSGSQSVRPSDQTSVQPGATVPRSRDGGGDQSSHRDD